MHPLDACNPLHPDNQDPMDFWGPVLLKLIAAGFVIGMGLAALGIC